MQNIKFQNIQNIQNNINLFNTEKLHPAQIEIGKTYDDEIKQNYLTPKNFTILAKLHSEKQQKPAVIHIGQKDKVFIEPNAYKIASEPENKFINEVSFEFIQAIIPNYQKNQNIPFEPGDIIYRQKFYAYTDEITVKGNNPEIWYYPCGAHWNGNLSLDKIEQSFFSFTAINNKIAQQLTKASMWLDKGIDPTKGLQKTTREQIYFADYPNLEKQNFTMVNKIQNGGLKVELTTGDDPQEVNIFYSNGIKIAFDQKYLDDPIDKNSTFGPSGTVEIFMAQK